MYELSQTYETLCAFGLTPRLFVEKAILKSDARLPIGTFTYTSNQKTGKVLQTDEIIETLQDVHLIVIGPGLELGSAVRILFEKILINTDTPIILSSELVRGLDQILAGIIAQRANVILYSSNSMLVRLAQKLELPVQIRPSRGVYNTVDVQDAVSKELDCLVVSYGDHELVVRDPSQREARGIVHLHAEMSDQLETQTYTFLGLMAGVLVGFNDVTAGFMSKVLSAGYLHNKIGAKHNHSRLSSLAHMQSVLQAEIG